MEKAFDSGILFKNQNCPCNLQYTCHEKLVFLGEPNDKVWVAIGQ